MGNSNKKVFPHEEGQVLEGGLRVVQTSTSLETLQASAKGLAHILVTPAVHHQQSFHFSRFWMPNLSPARWATTCQLLGYSEWGCGNTLLA